MKKTNNTHTVEHHSEPSEEVVLSPRAEKRFKKMEEDFKKGRNFKRYESLEEFFKSLKI